MQLKAVLVLLLSPALSFAMSMDPGMWETKTSLELQGLPLPPSEKKNCVTKTKTKDVKKAITEELEAKECKLTKWTLKGKNIEASVACDNKDIKAKGDLKGTVTPKSYELSGKADGSYKTLPTSVTFTLSGKWLEACKE